ncbi:hypothetical protein NKG05_15975 [Oerskovia sp. M15]
MTEPSSRGPRPCWPPRAESATALTLDGATTQPTTTLGGPDASFDFTVGSNSIEARYVNHLLVNGLRIDLTEDYVSQEVGIPIPATYLVPGENHLSFVTGTFTTSCGANRDDFAVSALGVTVPGGSATIRDLAPSYSVGDGDCGSNTTKPRQLDLVVDVTPDAATPTGLRLDLDTTTLPDGEHEVTATSVSGARSTRTVTTDNTGPVIVSSTPADGSTLGSAAALAVELEDLAGVASGPDVTLDGTPVAIGDPVGPGLAEGEHTLVVSAADVLGNTAQHEITFTSLGIPAVPTDLSPATGTRGLVGDVELSARVAAPGDGQVTATFRQAEALAPKKVWQGISPTVPTSLKIDGQKKASAEG